MKLIGVEVPLKTPFTLERNTILMVISDEHGVIRLVKIDKKSIADKKAFLRVPTNTVGYSSQQQPSVSNEKAGARAQGGCYVRLGDIVKWTDPCEQPG